MPAGQGSVGLAGLLPHGAVPVALQAWQEGENHKAVCQLRDSTVDFSSFPSRQCLFPKLSEGHQEVWAGSSVEVGTGAVLIRPLQLRANRVTY